MTEAPHCALTATSTPDDLLRLVKANSAGHRAVRAMSAWTDGSPPLRAEVLGWLRGAHLHLPRLDEIVALRVADAGRGAPEAVDIRALFELFTRDYLVLRCPWGWYEAAAGRIAGLVPMREAECWRSVDSGPTEDVFALDAPAFKLLFAGIGLGD